MTSFASQVWVMMKKNARLQLKGYKSLICIVLVAPILCMSVMALIYQSSVSAALASTLNPAPYSLGPVLKCIPANKQYCVSILYSPDTPLNKLIMNTFIQLNSKRGIAFNLESTTTQLDTLTSNLDIVPMSDDSVMHDYIFKYQNRTNWGVYFYNSSTNINVMNYEIWQNRTNNGVSSRTQSGVSEAAISLQRGLEEAILSIQQANVDMTNPPATIPISTNLAKMDYNIMGLPTIPASADLEDFQYPVRTLLPLIILISTIPQFIYVVSTVSNEESKGLVSGLISFGIWPSAYYLSHLLSSIPISMLNALLTTLFGGCVYGFEVLALGNVSVIWLANFLFQLCSVALALLIATVLRKPGVALFGAIALMIVFSAFQIVEGILMGSIGPSIPIYYLWYDSNIMGSPSVYQGMSMIPVFNFNKIWKDVFTLNARFRNTTTGALVTPPGYYWNDTVKNTFMSQYNQSYPGNADLLGSQFFDPIPNTGDSFGILVALTIFYFVLALSFDKIVTNNNGKNDVPWFFLLPQFWKSFLKSDNVEDLDAWIKLNKTLTTQSNDPGVMRKAESSEKDKSPFAIRLLDLTKKYGLFEKKLAVKGISFTFDQNQCLAFLGQNGGGKSTTLKILSGFLSSSSGDAIIYNKSVKTESHAIQQFSGITMQFDLLFPDLNAEEHMNMYCELKGIEGTEKATVMKDRLEQVLLWEVRKLPTRAYSGGMKRRLSVVLSTIGDPKFLILDEPTTGMDPFNRRL